MSFGDRGKLPLGDTRLPWNVPSVGPELAVPYPHQRQAPQFYSSSVLPVLHNLNQFPYSCGGHAPSPPGPVGVRGRDPGAQVGWWWSHHSGGPIPRVEGLGLAR